MNTLFQRLIKSAGHLTHRGDLRAATAAIQRALAQRSMQPSPAAYGPMVDDPSIYDPAEHEPPKPQPAAPQRPQAESGGRFIAGRHTGPAGSRDWRLYIPPQAGTRPLPLIVMLHGCTQNAADFAAGTAMNEIASPQGFFVLYPEQSREHNPQGCWNWFKHSHQARGRGEPALLAAMTRETMAAHAIDPARVFAAGLSAGGAMAAIMGDAYPDLFAAVGVHSGLATGVAKDLPSALGAMRGGRSGMPGKTSGVPTIVFHGDADATVHPGNGEQVITASVHTGADVQEHKGVAPGGRSYTRQVHRAPGGKLVGEHWLIHGSQHAWSGGTAKGSYTDPRGPDASAEMVRFFLEPR